MCRGVASAFELSSHICHVDHPTVISNQAHQYFYPSLRTILRQIVVCTWAASRFFMPWIHSVLVYLCSILRIPNTSVSLPVITIATIPQPCSTAGVTIITESSVWLLVRLPANSSNNRGLINCSTVYALVCGYLCRVFGSTLSWVVTIQIWIKNTQVLFLVYPLNSKFRG